MIFLFIIMLSLFCILLGGIVWYRIGYVSFRS